jgi:2-iminoacetate synthase ThiH
MSAGSKTNPGGYAGEEVSLEQFSISDERSPREVAGMLKEKGYDPVWKDWDSSYDLLGKTENGLIPKVSSRKSLETLSLAG